MNGPRRPSLALLLAAALLQAGCAIRPPQAWEKQHLARPEMALDTDSIEQRFAQQIYASKENSAGGAGVGGGGCGCN